MTKPTARGTRQAARSTQPHPLRIAHIAPVATTIPPQKSGSVELMTSLLTEGLVAHGHDVTLFATGDSTTSAKLHAIYPHGYWHDENMWPWELYEMLNLAAAVERALAGVTDSPAFLDGRFVGTAGFDGIDLAAHCDQLTAALAHAAEVSAARTHRLLDSRITGLPAQLARRPGLDAGLVAVHKRAAGEVHAIRRLAMPSAIGTIETSNGQEDVQSFAWAAAGALRTALRHARLVTSCELLTAYQAAALAGGPWPGRCQELLTTLSGLIDPIEADRQFGADIERLAEGSWLS